MRRVRLRRLLTIMHVSTEVVAELISTHARQLPEAILACNHGLVRCSNGNAISHIEFSGIYT